VSRFSSRIKIVSGHPIVIAWLKAVLSKDSVLRELLDIDATWNPVNSCHASEPLLFVVDSFGLTVTLSTFVHLQRSLHQENKFLVLLPEKDFGEENVIHLLHMGIDGVVQLSEKIETVLPNALLDVLNGIIVAPPRALAQFVRQVNLLERDRTLLRIRLTPRELQVLEMIVGKRSNKEIANLLNISERTIKFHVSNILAKLNVNDRDSLCEVIAAFSKTRLVEIKFNLQEGSSSPLPPQLEGQENPDNVLLTSLRTGHLRGGPVRSNQ
jgi:DNA-binding NarL/FixJ family response regulator